MSTTIFSWNVRGLRSRAKRAAVQQVIRMHNPTIIILQESKMPVVTNSDIADICGSRSMGWTYQPSHGASGGIIIIWKPSLVEVLSSLEGEFTLSIECRFIADGFHFFLTGVYGPNKVAIRKYFWRELHYIRGLWEIPWVIEGDFNVIRRCEEKNGMERRTKSMKKFSSFISIHSLIDLPLKGSKYTWTNGRAAPILSRIDRILISPDFEAKYHFVSQLAKTRPASDHIPIILDLADPSWGPYLFRMELMWFEHPDFMDSLKRWWSSFNFTGTPSSVMWNKLQALKTKLKEWNKVVFGRLDPIIEDCLQVIGDLDKAEAVTSSLDTDLFIKRAQAKVNF
ncbi:uncharacterized protein LOC113315502 [Papaver somniferum]|uniref:uncharacterized protein LOC113315502 n=1 Tax=Papaver somniferum TaxID=3469 RepID=UPI000E6FB5C4|nr:uncharacterized protein LOC113315502 [Papaver somniferum]